ncbi:hypothetical protein IMSHALPRED_005070 [Imshaugia aleurites]|uniref:Amidoligase enzyme n=1 Tax=Imshaugia aleurites TaxID=172621 RepID=A0A8H3IPC2_9LECA|nr:hypothetical protein IMSHALPRED_005070 [Imshaugia aleurites]
MNKKLNLTFGVEIECIVYFDPDHYEEGLPDSEGILWENEPASPYNHEIGLRALLRQHVIEFFRANGCPTYDLRSDGGDQKWTVTNDPSIETNNREEEKFLECDVEIKSPALHLCSKALGRVRDLVHLLTREFNVSVNNTCGLHVHIGNGRRGFPLQTLKQFSIMTAMFEHQLNSIHPAHRLSNPHAKGPSAIFQGQNPWDTVREIQRCRTKDQLALLYKNDEGYVDRRFAYNLCPVVSRPSKTIEFRQHEGTLDERQIVNWIHLAGGVVDAMHKISANDLAQLISTCAFDPSFTVCDLLGRLNLQYLIPYYFGRLHSHLRPEPIWVPARMDGSVEVVPRRPPALDRWHRMEERHKSERLGALEKLEELDKRHALERCRELERQSLEVDASRATQSQEGEEDALTTELV